MGDRLRVLLTGAGSGLGRLLLSALAGDGHSVVACVRDSSVQTLKESLEKESPAHSVRIESVDLAEPDSIDHLLKRLQNLSGIDVLINNAGLFTKGRECNSLGLEKQMMVNYLAPRRLTLGLKEMLNHSNRPRVLNISSRMHYRGHIDLHQFTHQRDIDQASLSYSGSAAYSDSKLALTAWSIGLARRWSAQKICILSQHPGVYATGIARQLPPPLRWMWNAFIPGPARGSALILDAALGPFWADHSGAYLDRDRIASPAAQAIDESFQEELERISEELLPIT